MITPATASWKPQAFGRRNVKSIRDPVIEPLWEGERLLIEAGPSGAGVMSPAGEVAIELGARISDALVDGVRAANVVVDGYLTPQPVRPAEGTRVFDVSVPTATEMAGQLLLGRSRARRRELAESLGTVDPDEAVALVVVDLLALDGEQLLDVPLLERKRLLESVLSEGPLVRFGTYVRPPVDPWLGTWRALGFHSIAYKAANSRYRPGERNDAWAIARIPQR
jgi:ATP dependent DNA ligase-like protein